MTERLKQTIKDEMEKLAEENREAINAVDWVKITEEIGKNFLLEEDQVTNLQTETFLVLASLEEPSSYKTNIENEICVSEKKAKQIAEEVFEKIFNPIKNLLKENYKKTAKKENASPEQNLDFILSGGNYSAFVKRDTPVVPATPETAPTTNLPPIKTKIEDVKTGNTPAPKAYTKNEDPYRMKPE
jgi:hypothetical protein